MVDPARYLPFNREPLRGVERRFGRAVAVPETSERIEPAGVGHYDVDGVIEYVDVFVFDHEANQRGMAWYWPRVRTELVEPGDDPIAALERAAREFMQGALRGDSIDEDVMRAVERESERRLCECPRGGAELTLEGQPARGHRITWGTSWFTAVDTGDPRLAITVLGPERWSPVLRRSPS